jgi:hypothetical protein
MKWKDHPNPRRRPRAPNKGRGRLQQQLRRAFYGGTELTTSQVLDWTNVRNRQRLTGRHRYLMLGNAEHPNQITSWKAQLEGGAADVFGPGGSNGVTQPAVDVKSLHAKIGALTLENDFLEGALSKAGLLSAKR